MKTENILDAMGALEESMLMESLPQKRRNFRPLAAVAILAAALCVTTGAAYLIAPAIVPKGDRQMVQMEYGGVDWPEGKAEELLARAEKQRAVSKMPLTRFDSLEEMEADLELELLDNDLRTQEQCHYQVYGNANSRIDIFVFYYPWDGNAVSHDAGDLRVSIMAYVNPAAGEGIGWVLPQKKVTEWTQTSVYQMTHLDTAARIYCDKDGAQAWFVKDGIGYEVSCRGGVQVMQMVLDSFHY